MSTSAAAKVRAGLAVARPPHPLRPLSGQNSRGVASAAGRAVTSAAPCEEIFDSVSGPFGTSLRPSLRAERGGRG